jgi:hypothetical protein
MRAALVVVLVVVSLAGCTTAYEKPGATEDEFERTFASCRAESAFLPARASLTEFLQNCMRAQGWTAKTVRSSPEQPPDLGHFRRGD